MPKTCHPDAGPATSSGCSPVRVDVVGHAWAAHNGVRVPSPHAMSCCQVHVCVVLAGAQEHGHRGDCIIVPVAQGERLACAGPWPQGGLWWLGLSSPRAAMLNDCCGLQLLPEHMLPLQAGRFGQGGAGSGDALAGYNRGGLEVAKVRLQKRHPSVWILHLLTSTLQAAIPARMCT